MTRLLNRLGESEDGLTLIELLFAASLGIVIVFGATTMLISAVRTQPHVSEQAQNVQQARWVQERLTREIRNGIRVDEATSSRISFVTKVRRTSCGGATISAASVPARECQVVYDCSSGTGCTRSEAAVGASGTPKTIFTGISSSQVFNFSPNAEDPTYVGITMRIPNSRGPGSLTVSDGASLRTPTMLSSG